ncbi:MAG TPA: hypothetical protein V6D11_19000 [Waterburya sp.]
MYCYCLKPDRDANTGHFRLLSAECIGIDFPSTTGTGYSRDAYNKQTPGLYQVSL